ncbi:MAG: histone deacetylase family protein [Alphaproteobacteria bacterium]|nr:histone deacetylase family protein [Alphaproteobacteria bacterium]MBF0250407.1 histone deacetylase family protein [Alphaproteobacteria bacterium]
MSTLFITHPSGYAHDTGPGHPERPARLKAVEDALSGPRFDALVRRDAPRGSVWDIKRVHSDEHIRAVFDAVPEDGFNALDHDTVVSPGSGEAALFAVGGVCAAVDAVYAGEVDNAFCALRPPGHHAERDRTMGFCLFNTIAIAAFHALELVGVERVAVMDFDVHHGNGTQQAFWDHENLFYASTHQMPCFPGTGSERERGRFGNIANAPLPPGAGSEDFRDAFGFLRPALKDFAPDFLLISAGFDAHAADPLAMLNLHEDDFAWVTDELLAIAAASAKGRVVSTLEGGYDLEALGRGVAAHVAALMGA